jgi:hypothetical protein
MIKHMVEETQRVMKGTKHEGHGKFYHDALALVTCKKSIKYMKNKEYFKHWLLPLEGLQHGTRYNESIHGDSPELMPLDENLNLDIHASACYHVVITAHLPNDDPIKYPFSTPNKISRAYLRLVHHVTGGAPSCNQFVQDCEKWIRSLMKRKQAGGKMVEGFGRNGHRRGNQGKRGDYQAKKPRKAAKGVHSDASGLTQTQWRSSMSLVNSTLSIIDPQSTITPATETASSTATSGEKSKNNNKSEEISPLTIQYVSDIEDQNSNCKMNTMFEERLIVGSDSAYDDEESIEDRFGRRSGVRASWLD